MLREAGRLPRSATILVAILIMATGVRLYDLGKQCFWIDELLTMELINGHGHPDMELPRNVIIAHPRSLTDPSAAAPWWKIWNRESGYGDVHPPLYFVLCRWWRDIFGNSEAQVRSLSVVFSLAGIAVFYAVVKECNGKAAGLWAALLMAVSAPQAAYAQEARNYSLLTLVSLLAAWAIVRIERRGLNGWRWSGLAAALLATALTHYFSFGVLAAMAVYALLVFRGRTLIAVLGAFVTAGLLFVLTWGKNLLRQRQILLHGYSLYGDPHHHVRITLLRALAMPVRHLIGISLGPEASFAAAAGLAAAGLLTLLYRRRDLLFWWLWLVGGIATVTIIDLARTSEQLTMVKYAFAAAPGVFVIAAAVAPRKWRYLSRAIPALIVAMEIYFLPRAYVSWKGDWRGAALTVIALTPPADPVVIAGNGTSQEFLSWIYLGMNFYINPWPRMLAISDREPSADLMKQLRNYQQITLVTDCPISDPGAILPGFVPLGAPQFFPNVAIVWEMKRK